VAWSAVVEFSVPGKEARWNSNSCEAVKTESSSPISEIGPDEVLISDLYRAIGLQAGKSIGLSGALLQTAMCLSESWRI
jgi:hypothetical protein